MAQLLLRKGRVLLVLGGPGFRKPESRSSDGFDPHSSCLASEHGLFRAYCLGSLT